MLTCVCVCATSLSSLSDPPLARSAPWPTPRTRSVSRPSTPRASCCRSSTRSTRSRRAARRRSASSVRILRRSMEDAVWGGRGESLPCLSSVSNASAKNGVVIATEKKLPTILVDETSSKKIEILSENAGIVYSGLGPDYRVLVRKARKKAQTYFQKYKVRLRRLMMMTTLELLLTVSYRSTRRLPSSCGSWRRSCRSSRSRAACVRSASRSSSPATTTTARSSIRSTRRARTLAGKPPPSARTRSAPRPSSSEYVSGGGDLVSIRWSF